MSNGNGSYNISMKAHMRAYDALPPKAREAVRNAKTNWVCTGYLKLWNGGKLSPKGIAARVGHDDEWLMRDSRQSTRLVYGANHPESLAPTIRKRRK